MSPFDQKMNEGINQQIETELHFKQKEQARSAEDEQKIQKLLQSAATIQSTVQIRVANLSRSDMGIEKKNLHGEMEETMVLHSNIIEDIFQVKSVIEKLKVILNSVVGILYHNLKFKNQYRLKSAKDMDTYLVQDPAYNSINIRIKELQNFVERSQEFSGMIRQKIGFIRDLTKMRTQEMFSEK